MVKKVVLKSVSKDKTRCVFGFEKSWEVVDAIDGALGKLALPSQFENRLKDIMNCKGPVLVDYLHNMKNDECSVDVFFGKENIILIINSREDRQEYISEAVFEFAEFGDVEKKGLSKLGDMDLDGN